MARPRIYATNAKRQAAYRRRKNRSVLFRSDSHEWATPADLFQELDEEFSFTLDVCATKENAQCDHFYTLRQDGLKQPWRGVCWCNPPYGRNLGLWIEKALHSSQEEAATVVCLIPARTDTRWWHDHVLLASEVRFLKGRLKFGGHENSAPFASVVVVFKPVPESNSQVTKMLDGGEYSMAESITINIVGRSPGLGDRF